MPGCSGLSGYAAGTSLRPLATSVRLNPKVTMRWAAFGAGAEAAAQIAGSRKMCLVYEPLRREKTNMRLLFHLIILYSLDNLISPLESECIWVSYTLQDTGTMKPFCGHSDP